MNDKPGYEIGIQQTPDGGWCVVVVFEACSTQEEAVKMCDTIAPLIQKAVGGTQEKVVVQ